MKKIKILFSCVLISVASHIFASNDATHTASVSLDGEWTMLTLKGKDINTIERPFLFFNVSDSTLYGNNGCNVINGTFSTNAAHKISIDNIITSLAECHNHTSERNIMKALNEATSYKISEENGIRHLTLLNSKGHNLMYLKNQDINFLNGAWTVSSIAGESVSAKNVRIVIDIQEMKIHGNSGCNIFNGTLFIDPYKDWGVEFQKLISTRKMCRDIYIETALLVALEETQFCKQISKDEILLLGRDNIELATLKRLNLK